MALGFDVYEDNRDFSKEGITGTVKRHSIENASYPNIIVEVDDEHPVESYKFQVLKSMLNTSSVFDNSVDGNNAIALYFKQSEKVAKIGQIFPQQVKAFLRLFESNNLSGYYSETEKIDGMYLYVLSE
jgi:hypothetical protein